MKNNGIARKIQQWAMDVSYSKHNLFIQRLVTEGFDDEQILKVIGVVDRTCMICYDGDKGCQCWNDE